MCTTGGGGGVRAFGCATVLETNRIGVGVELEVGNMPVTQSKTAAGTRGSSKSSFVEIFSRKKSSRVAERPARFRDKTSNNSNVTCATTTNTTTSGNNNENKGNTVKKDSTNTTNECNGDDGKIKLLTRRKGINNDKNKTKCVNDATPITKAQKKSSSTFIDMFIKTKQKKETIVKQNITDKNKDKNHNKINNVGNKSTADDGTKQSKAKETRKRKTVDDETISEVKLMNSEKINNKDSELMTHKRERKKKKIFSPSKTSPAKNPSTPMAKESIKKKKRTFSRVLNTNESNRKDNDSSDSTCMSLWDGSVVHCGDYVYAFSGEDIMKQLTDNDDCHNDSIHKSINSDKNKEEDEEEGYLCVLCGQSDQNDKNNMIIECDHCLMGFHCKCLKPQLKEVPQVVLRTFTDITIR